MRPRLRDDVRYVKCPEGVYVHALGGACTLKGTQSYEWLSRLAPHLTGERTLDELVGPLAADQRTMVEGLVRTLSEQRFVVDVVGDEPHLLDAEEQRVYAAEIAFIRYGLDSAQRRFQRVRAARIVLIGEGPVLDALLAAGLWSGWRKLGVFAPAAQVTALRDVVEKTRRDPKQSVRLQPWPEERGAGDRGWLAGVVDEADVVLQVCDEARRADLIAVSRACAGSGTALGQVLVGDDEAWLTPVGPPDGVEAESCWRRLAAQRGTGADTPSGGGWLTGPVPGIVAAQLALSCFSHLTGLDDTLPSPQRAPQPPVLNRVDLRTLVTRTHRVRPHPLAGPQAPNTEADVRALIDELACAAPVEAADLLDRVAGCIDARTGLLGILDEGDLVQVPLSVCRASVSDPYAVLPAWAPAPTVTGWGNDRPTARLRALLAALATYGTLTTGPVTEQQWGLDLATGALRAVPTTVAYPVLRGAPLPYRAPVGAAAGRCWNDAIAAGLRAHCEALLAQHTDGGRRDIRQLDPTEVADEVADEQAAHLLRLVQAADQRVRVTDLSGILKLPAFAFRTGADPVVLTCAATAAEALRDGLERILLRWQARTEGGMPLPRASAVLWPVEPPPPPAGGPGADPRCRVLTGALRRAGQRPVAVPITQDRQARSLLPYVVQVVLCDD
ncbi:MAG: hypothetical protein ACRDSZ_04955 [Pseudonocardiaceae bacterium]